jgi:DNA-directed RNA polymerase subunit RPC12/RpoP
MSQATVRDRRFRPERPLVVRECRLCWKTIEIDRAHVEMSNQLAYVRCDHCGGSFPIRHSDLDAVVGSDSTTA